MADSMRGADTTQDTRFKDKEAASIKATKFPPHFSEKVDLRKVNLSVLRPWIAKRVTELIKVEDDVVVEYVYSMLEDKDKPIPDAKKMQVSLVGFMDKYGAAAFMDELWKLLLSAQSTVGGVPAEFIAAKKAELEARQREGGPNLQDQMRARTDAISSRDGGGRRDDRGPLPPRPGGPPPFRDRDEGYRSRPPRQYGDRDRVTDRGPYRGDRGGRGYGGEFERRDRDNGYGARGGAVVGGRDRSPSAREGHRRRSPSPAQRRRSPSPVPAVRRIERSVSRSPIPVAARKRGRDESPPATRRRRSSATPTPERRRDRSPTVTPPRRLHEDSHPRRRRDDDTPPRRRRDDDTPPRRRRDDDTPPRRRRDDDTPPRRRRDDETPPRRRREDDTPPRRERVDSPIGRSPSPVRRRVSDVDEDGGSKRERDDTRGSRRSKLDGPLAQSKWA